MLYPLAALALAFQQLRVRPNATSWVALLGFPVLGVAGLALSYHPENLERSGEGLEFAQALGALVDPMVLNAPNAGAGIAFPLPLLALGLLSRLGARGWPLWVGTAAAWGIGVGLAFLEFSPGWLLVVGVPLALALATRQWARGAAPPVDLLLLLQRGCYHLRTAVTRVGASAIQQHGVGWLDFVRRRGLSAAKDVR